jgi:hypothetical protein
VLGFAGDDSDDLRPIPQTELRSPIVETDAGVWIEDRGVERRARQLRSDEGEVRSEMGPHPLRLMAAGADGGEGPSSALDVASLSGEVGDRR